MCPGAEVLQASILIVDDVATDARRAESILRDAGYVSVMTTTEPGAVCDLHRERAFDLVILDLAMPGMDGFEVMAALAACSQRRPQILAITGDPADFQRALQSGARDFVSKPLREPELRARVRNLLEVGLAMRALSDRGEELERALLERTASLRESERLFRLFAEQVPEAVWIRQRGLGAFRYVSPKFSEVMGRTIAAGDNVEKVLESIHRDDRVRVAELMRSHPDGGVEAEVRFVRPDGRERHGYVRTFPIAGPKGVPEWVGGILEDITERHEMERELREAESRFRALVEQSIAGIYAVEGGVWTYVNPRLCEMLGYPAEELLGRPSTDFIHEDDLGRLLDNRARAQAGSHSAMSATYRFRRKDGRVVHLSLETRRIAQAGSLMLLGVAQDVTERVRSQQLLREARAELESANRRLQYLSDRVIAIQEEERRALSGELHDDVGQSLLALQIGLHRLAQHSVQAKPQLLTECVDIVNAVQDKLREVSLRLHPPQLTQLGLADALRALVSRQRATTGLDIRCSLEGPFKGELSSGAEIACYRICQEALNNATRHARAGVIEVRTKRQRGRLCLSIHDDGAGFDADERREAANTSGNMGLISMEERARLAGGELEMRTAPGAGTVVIAMFPLDIRGAAAAAGE